MLRTRRALLLISLAFIPASALAQQTRTPVLVELFTSEGCSSCPPADALLALLDHDQPVPNADIIVLGEHVDYWDSLGWKDRFSSPDFTQRQKTYQDFFQLGDVYTPQIVVNGSAQFTGSDREGIEKAIARASASQTVPLKLTGVEIRGSNVRFTLQNGPDTPGYVNVYAALVDPFDTTEVRAGENGGRTLHHAGVVRTFGLIGSSWRTKDLGRHPDQPFMIPSHGTASLNGMRLIVFVQTKHIGPVLGAASCVLSTTPHPATSDAPFPANRCPVAPPTVASSR